MPNPCHKHAKVHADVCSGKTTYQSHSRQIEGTKRKHIFAPRAESRAARRQVSCTELGPEFSGPLRQRLLSASQRKLRGKTQWSCKPPATERGPPTRPTPTRSGSHVRSWCGVHRTSSLGEAVPWREGVKRAAPTTEAGVEATTRAVTVPGRL